MQNCFSWSASFCIRLTGFVALFAAFWFEYILSTLHKMQQQQQEEQEAQLIVGVCERIKNAPVSFPMAEPKNATLFRASSAAQSESVTTVQDQNIRTTTYSGTNVPDNDLRRAIRGGKRPAEPTSNPEAKRTRGLIRYRI